MTNKKEQKNLVANRKAAHDYFLLDTYEAGIALLGSEVKSLRAGRGNLKEAHIQIDKKGAWLHGCHIATYEMANRNNHEPTRVRQLLLHQTELRKLSRAVKQQGMTIVPVRIYIKGSHIKVEISAAKGKKLYDKRHTLKEKQIKRETDRRNS